jgi:hypothetical protein
MEIYKCRQVLPADGATRAGEGDDGNLVAGVLVKVTTGTIQQQEFEIGNVTPYPMLAGRPQFGSLTDMGALLSIHATTTYRWYHYYHERHKAAGDCDSKRLPRRHLVPQ